MLLQYLQFVLADMVKRLCREYVIQVRGLSRDDAMVRGRQTKLIRMVENAGGV